MLIVSQQGTEAFVHSAPQRIHQTGIVERYVKTSVTGVPLRR